MGRTRNNTYKIYSTVSDDTLAALLDEDYKRTPEDFRVSEVTGMTNTRNFLMNTAGRAIEPMRKWL